tara:strand:- start:140 stop:349 length:210 start_codon:yes stop_codon:yes gene_type:complete
MDFNRKNWQHIDNVVKEQYKSPVQYTHAKYIFNPPFGSDSKEYIACTPIEHKKIKLPKSNNIDMITVVE